MLAARSDSGLDSASCSASASLISRAGRWLTRQETWANGAETRKRICSSAVGGAVAVGVGSRHRCRSRCRCRCRCRCQSCCRCRESVALSVRYRCRCWCRCLCRMWQCNASFIWQRQQRTRLPHAARRTWAKTKTKRHAAVGGKDEGHANNLQAVAKLCFHLAAARGKRQWQMEMERRQMQATFAKQIVSKFLRK